jgi:hypothetical protein
MGYWHRLNLWLRKPHIPDYEDRLKAMGII